MAWFGKETDGLKANNHGEAPLLAVVALITTAALTLAFFAFNGPLIELERQVMAAPL